MAGSKVKKVSKLAGIKLSTAEKKKRADKAAMTRCVHKCEATGGRRVSRVLSPSKKKAAKDRAETNLGPWLRHLAAVRKAHPDAGGKAQMALASAEWQKLKAAAAAGL